MLQFIGVFLPGSVGVGVGEVGLVDSLMKVYRTFTFIYRSDQIRNYII